MIIYDNNIIKHDVYLDNMTIEKCNTIYDHITKYVDFDDSINQFITINTDDDEKLLTFYFYGMERNNLYIYGYFNEYDNSLHIIFNDCDYDYMLDIILDSINE